MIYFKSKDYGTSFSKDNHFRWFGGDAADAGFESSTSALGSGAGCFGSRTPAFGGGVGGFGNTPPASR